MSRAAKLAIAFGGLCLTLIIATAGLIPTREPLQRTTSAPPMPAPTIEEVKAQARLISYDELARHPDAYKGELVRFHGHVVQAFEEGDSWILRINVTKGPLDIWQDTIMAALKRETRAPARGRILEGDVVQLWGRFVRIHSYKSVFGLPVQIPFIAAIAVE